MKLPSLLSSSLVPFTVCKTSSNNDERRSPSPPVAGPWDGFPGVRRCFSTTPPVHNLPPPPPIRNLVPVLSPSKTLAPTTPASAMKGKAGTSKKGDGRLKAAGGASKRKKAAASGKPKRPPSAFFVFMSEFRQEYQAQHPDNKSVAAVSKAAGEKWRSMSEEEKAPYHDKAGQKKQDYEKSKADFDKKESTSSKKSKTEDEEGEGSDKSKSEVDDDDQDGGSDEENDEDE